MRGHCVCVCCVGSGKVFMLNEEVEGWILTNVDLPQKDSKGTSKTRKRVAQVAQRDATLIGLWPEASVVSLSPGPIARTRLGRGYFGIEYANAHSNNNSSSSCLHLRFRAPFSSTLNALEIALNVFIKKDW